MPNKFWQFRNMADGSGELLLYGNIAGEKSWYSDDVTPKQFAEDLAGLGTVSNITVRINSGGGDVFAAVEIGNLLEQHPATVTARIGGVCASAATIIACHCNKVIAANDSTYMVHPVSMYCGYANAADLQKYLEALATIKEMIGVASSHTLPEVNMQTSTVSGMGVNGEVDSPTLGQFESMEQEIQFNTLYSSAVDMLNPLNAINLTFRAAQQVYDKSTGGGYAFKSLRIVEMGRVKKFKPGKIEKAESMEATITLELTYLLVEVDGVVVMEIDKLNQVYNVNGVDMAAGR